MTVNLRFTPSKTQPLLAGVALALIGIFDCALLQLVHGGRGAWTIAQWSFATLVPLAAGAAAIAWSPAPRRNGWSTVLALAAAGGALLILLVVADLILFPEPAPDWLAKARSKAPGVMAFVGLGVVARRHKVAASLHAKRQLGLQPSGLSVDDRMAIAAAVIVRAAGNYVELHAPGTRTRLVRVPISRLASISEAAGFVRLHRSVMVRRSAVTAWHNNRSGLIAAQLTCGSIVPIGRHYRKAAYALRDSCRSSRAS